MRVIFFGTAELAVQSLEAIARAPSLELVAVVTQPDRPKGRALKLQPSPVKAEALRLTLPVLQPEKARHPEFIEELRRLEPDLIVVAAYGQILPQSLLDLPRHGCLNVHTSLLPKYRGAAPIQWAILNDESETGVTIMKMDAGLDTGAILTQEATPILPSDNAQTIHDRLAAMGGKLLVQTIPGYIAGRIVPRPQPEEGSSYARKITKEDGRIDWTQPARVLWNRVRAFTPWPGAYTVLPGNPGSAAEASLSDGAKPSLMKIWEADVSASARGAPGEVIEAGPEGLTVACGQEALRIRTLQREGGKRLSAAEFLRGHPLPAGTRLRGA